MTETKNPLSRGEYNSWVRHGWTWDTDMGAVVYTTGTAESVSAYRSRSSALVGFWRVYVNGNHVGTYSAHEARLLDGLVERDVGVVDSLVRLGSRADRRKRDMDKRKGRA